MCRSTYTPPHPHTTWLSCPHHIISPHHFTPHHFTPHFITSFEGQEEGLLVVTTFQYWNIFFSILYSFQNDLLFSLLFWVAQATVIF